MALGTPVAAAAAYSTSGGTTVSPAYPAGILATDVVLLFVGQKPSTANGGTVTTPTGWTLREELTAAGGYGATLGADTGNTNLRIYSWNTPVAGQTGNLTVTLGVNNISWAFMVRVPTGGSFSFGSADGQRTTAPTANVAFATALTNGTSATDFATGDLAIWAMCIPTDVTTPGQFSAQSVTATGATFATAVELNEPDSQTGNDIGGYSAYASVSSGSSTTAPTVTVTAGGTVTNVRGPIVLLRIRDTAQTLTPALFTNTNTVYNPTVTPGGVTLTPSLFTNTSTFYTPTVLLQAVVVQVSWLEIEPFPIQTLTPARFDNTNTFYTPTVTAGEVTLSPARFDNTNVFYAPTVAAGEVTLTPALFANTNTFYTPTVAAGEVTLSPARFDNTNVFYAPTVTAGEVTLTPDRFDNTNTFYTPTVSAGEVTLTPALFANTNTFYTPTVAAGEVTLTPDRFDNTNTFYTPTVLLQAVVQVSWLEIEATAGQTLLPSLFTNQNTFYAHTLNTQTTITADAGTVQVLGSNAQRELSVAADAGTLNVAGQAADFAITEALLPALFTNTNTFYAPTVSQGSLVEVSWLEIEAGSVAQTLLPALFNNQNTFYSATVNTQTTITADGGTVQVLGSNAQRELSVVADGGSVTVSGQTADFVITEALLPTLFTNTNTFYSAAVTLTDVLLPNRFDNTNTFYSATVTAGTATLSPARFDNQNAFFPFVTTLFVSQAARLDNTNTFYSATVAAQNIVQPPLFVNSNAFYSPTITVGPVSLLPSLFVNTSTFYSATLIIPQVLYPSLFTNQNTIYLPSAVSFYNLVCEDYVDPGYVANGYVTFAAFNQNNFYPFTSTVGAVVLVNGNFGTGLVGEVNFGWTPIDDNQTPNWQNVDDSQTSNWAPVVSSQTSNWQSIPV